MQPKLNKFAAITVSPSMPSQMPDGSESSGSDLDVFISTQGTTKSLYYKMQSLVADLQDNPLFINVKTNLLFNNIVWSINFKRDQMESYNVIPTDVSNTMNILFASKNIGNVISGNQTYPITVQMQKKDLSRFSILNDVYVKVQTLLLIIWFR